MKPLQMPLEEGKYYHVFNRGNNGDTIFYKPENYKFFLRRMEEYLMPFIEVYAYCLMPNHFHLLIRVKERTEALLLKDAKLLGNEPGELASQAFHRLFTSYSKAINKQEKRHGSLFENPFKRKVVTDERYFTNLVFYIHANPQLHCICQDFRQYPWSSYERIISGNSSELIHENSVEWVGRNETFIDYHPEINEIDQFRDLLLE